MERCMGSMLNVFMLTVVQRTVRHVKSGAMLAMTALILLVVSLSVVQAQSSDVQALLDRINRLEADLNNVQRKVFQGQDVPPPSSITSAAGSPLAGGEAAALLSARIDALEEEQRRITGTTEEVNFQVDQLKNRLNKLVLDIDFRLTEIERKLENSNMATENTGQNMPADALTMAPPANTDQQLSTAPTPSTPQTGTVAEGGELPKGTRLLGTLKAPGSGDAVPAANPAASEAAAALPATPVGTPAEQYNRAMGLIRKDDYEAAEAAFTAFLKQNKDHALAGNAQYWLGETYYVRGDFTNAATSFLNGYQNYPENSKAADNLLKLAMTLGRMDQVEEACATIDQLFKQFTKLPARLKRIADREKLKFKCS